LWKFPHFVGKTGVLRDKMGIFSTKKDFHKPESRVKTLLLAVFDVEKLDHGLDTSWFGFDCPACDSV